jgi:hypothetical protein
MSDPLEARIKITAYNLDSGSFGREWPRDMMTGDLAAPLFDPMLSGLSRAASDMAARWSMAQVPHPISQGDR